MKMLKIMIFCEGAAIMTS